MAKNKVQFQKGISIHQFIEKYGTETQCHNSLFDMRWPMGYHCPHCDHDKCCKLKSRALYQCNKCHFQTSLISGTLFAHSKLPLTTWFLAIYFVTQEKNGISALELSRLLGISYNATWRLKQKLMQTMKERDDEIPLVDYVQMDDAYWGDVRRGVRGRGAAAVSINDEGHPIGMRFSAVDGFNKVEITRWAKAHLTPKSIVISDGLMWFNSIGHS